MSPNEFNASKSPEVVAVLASAGSGKTYALAKRYLQLLINKDFPPKYIRKILAITFTNQTAYEMKERILEFLKKIALDDFSDSQEENDITCGITVNKKEAQKRALELMDYIIRNYNFFQVQTIDSFINLILCGCAYRLKLSSSFKIKENYQDYLAYSLDECIERANHHETIRQLFNDFLHQYLYIENRSGWFPKENILNLIGALFYHATLYAAAYKKFDLKRRNLYQEKQKILSLLRELHDKLPIGINKRFANTLEGFLKQNEDSFDFRSFTDKRSFLSEELAVSKGYQAGAELKNLWKKIRKNMIRLAEDEALSLFNRYIDIFGVVYEVFREYASKEDTLFLGELNQQAKTLIGENNVTVPELYYRLATRFEHYLIDEFQDTSFLQWQNLFLMVEDALASGGSLFYVGDKKQAIYRFRGGDVSLFNRIKGDFSQFNPHLALLNINYRSHKEIVEFNNAIFSQNNLRRFLRAQRPPKDDDLKYLSEEDIEMIVNIFSDSKQQYRKDKPHGFVKVEFLDCQDKEERDEKVKEQFLKRLKDLKGRNLEDIAVLCRTNKDVEQVSGWLIENDIAVESEKTLNIRNNQFIKEIVCLLKFLNSPIDNLSFASFILGDIFSKAAGFAEQEIKNFLFSFREEIRNDKTFYIYRQFKNSYPSLWDTYLEDFFKNVGLINPYELVVDIFKRFGVLENFSQYQGFFMHFLQLIKDNEEEYQSLRDFLEYFETAPDEHFYVNASDTKAVKVMSIHKAKGLGFGVVIIPFLELDIAALGSRTRSGAVPYVLAQEEDGLYLRRLDAKYTKLSPKICAEYRKEYKKSFLDELNAIYVAFTRAKNELYIFIPYDKKRNNNAAQFLIPDEYLERGKIHTEESEAKEDVVSLSIPPAQYADWISLLEDEFVQVSTLKNRENILKGEILHFILSQISNLKQIDKGKALGQAVEKARFTFSLVDDFSPFTLIVKKLLEAQSLKKFFYLDEGLVFQEKEIVNSLGITNRIDRLIVQEKEVWVIDYKSKAESLKDYKEQLKNYRQILKELYPDKAIRSFIIFLEEISVEEIHG